MRGTAHFFVPETGTMRVLGSYKLFPQLVASRTAAAELAAPYTHEPALSLVVRAGYSGAG